MMTLMIISDNSDGNDNTNSYDTLIGIKGKG